MTEPENKPNIRRVSLRNWPERLIFSIFIFSICAVWNKSWIDPGERRYIIGSDGVGYYSYLPAIFIYNDPSFSFADSLKHTYINLGAVGGSGFCRDNGNSKVNKYFIGEAVLAAPFFLCAHAAAKLTGYPADGFSLPYLVGHSVSTITWTCIGLLFLVLLLRRMKIPEGRIFLLIGLTYFGTHLYHYTLWEPSMSHAYSFAMVSIFLYFVHRLPENLRLRDVIITSVILGIITITRPVNIIVVLSIPFMAGDPARLRTFLTELLKLRTRLAYPLLAFALVIFLQLIPYKLQSGHWFVYAYTTERFYFKHPHFFRFLFSYENGTFVYAPMLFVFLLGMLSLIRKQLFRFISFLAFFSIVVYILSCWWAWTYAGAFGMRPMVEYIPFFVITGAFLLNAIGSFGRFILTTFILLPLVYILQVQVWQYSKGIIGYAKMTESKYWKVFLQTEKPFHFINNNVNALTVPPGLQLITEHEFAFESPDPLVMPYYRFLNDSDNTSAVMNLSSNSQHSSFFSGTIEQLIPDTSIDFKDSWLEFELWFKLNPLTTDAQVVGSLARNEQAVCYSEESLLKFADKAKTWTKMIIVYHSPTPLQHNDRFCYYVKKTMPGEILVDHVKLRVYSSR